MLSRSHRFSPWGAEELPPGFERFGFLFLKSRWQPAFFYFYKTIKQRRGGDKRLAKVFP
jgi:hypothetical protein